MITCKTKFAVMNQNPIRRNMFSFLFQVIIFMALADGKSRIRIGPLTLHTKTAIFVAELLTKV